MMRTAHKKSEPRGKRAQSGRVVAKDSEADEAATLAALEAYEAPSAAKHRQLAKVEADRARGAPVELPGKDEAQAICESIAKVRRPFVTLSESDQATLRARIAASNRRTVAVELGVAHSIVELAADGQTIRESIAERIQAALPNLGSSAWRMVHVPTDVREALAGHVAASHLTKVARCIGCPATSLKSALAGKPVRKESFEIMLAGLTSLGPVGPRRLSVTEKRRAKLALGIDSSKNATPIEPEVLSSLAAQIKRVGLKRAAGALKLSVATLARAAEGGRIMRGPLGKIRDGIATLEAMSSKEDVAGERTEARIREVVARAEARIRNGVTNPPRGPRKRTGRLAVRSQPRPV